MLRTRREFGTLALAAVPAFALQSRPDSSKVRGVMIGMNVPYNFGGRNAAADDIIQNCVALGVSGVELRTQPVEGFLGVPADLVLAGRGDGRGRGAATPPTAEEVAAQRARAGQLANWRLSVSMDKVRALRKRFDDAGVLVEIVKVDDIFDMSDEVIDYQFTLARTLGARAISTEIAEEGPSRLGKFADKHKLMVGYHGHAETGMADFERVFSYAAHNGANLDIGHFVAGQNIVACAVLQTAPRPDHAYPRQGSQDERRTEHAVRPGRHANRRGAAGDQGQRLEHPGDDRVRVPGTCRLRSDDRAQAVRRLLPRGAGVRSSPGRGSPRSPTSSRTISTSRSMRWCDVGMTGAELRIVDGRNIIELDDDEIARVRAAVERRGMTVVSIASPVLKCVLPDGPPLDPRVQQDVFGSRYVFEDQPRLTPAGVRDRRADRGRPSFASSPTGAPSSRNGATTASSRRCRALPMRPSSAA